MPSKAVCILQGPSGVDGKVVFTEDAMGTKITGRIRGLPPGQHAFRVHTLGDMSNAPKTCGPVYDPMLAKKPKHERQAGDLGAIIAGSDGIAGASVQVERMAGGKKPRQELQQVSMCDRNVPINGDYNVMGRAVVICNMTESSHCAHGIIAVLADEE